jgi:hypothetical protein
VTSQRCLLPSLSPSLSSPLSLFAFIQQLFALN